MQETIAEDLEQHGPVSVRLTAVEASEAMDRREAVAALRGATSDKSQMVRDAASRVLSMYSNQM